MSGRGYTQAVSAARNRAQPGFLVHLLNPRTLRWRFPANYRMFPGYSRPGASDRSCMR